jgi:hypothetical protein
VKVIQAFSGILGEAVLASYEYDLVTLLNRLRQVPFPPVKALFVGVDVLLAVRRSLSISFVMYGYDRLPVSSYDAPLELFECLGNFPKRLKIYTMVPPTPIMTEVIVKIMVELLLVLALATSRLPSC